MTEMQLFFSLIVALYAVLLLGTGWLTRKYSKDLKGYALGGFFMSSIIWGFSNFATWMSASTWMGVPALCYSYGLSFWLAQVCGVIIMCPLAQVLLGRKLRVHGEKLGALGFTDYIAARFESNIARLLAVAANFILAIVFTIAQLKATGTIFSYVFGFPFEAGVIISAIVCLAYLWIGGMAAATLSDTYEGIIMLLTAVLLLPGALIAVGGFGGLIEGLNKIDPGLTQPFYAWWTPLNLVGSWAYWFIGYVSLPYLTRQFFALKSSSWKEIPKFMAMFAIGNIIGMTMSLSGAAARVLGIQVRPPYGPDLAVVSLMEQILPPVFAVVGYWGITAAVMSSLEDWLHVPSVDIGALINATKPSERVKKYTLTLSKLAMPIILIVSIAYCIVSPPPFLSLLMYAGMSIVFATFFIPVITGLFYKKATKHAIIASQIAGIIAGAWLYDYTAAFHPLTVYLRGAFTVAVAAIVFIIVQLITLKTLKERAVPKTAEILFG
jgi:Na+/proline symporter